MSSVSSGLAGGISGTTLVLAGTAVLACIVFMIRRRPMNTRERATIRTEQNSIWIRFGEMLGMQTCRLCCKKKMSQNDQDLEMNSMQNREPLIENTRIMKASDL